MEEDAKWVKRDIRQEQERLRDLAGREAEGYYDD